MTDQTLAERAIACPHWDWIRGMRTLSGYRLIGYDNGGWQAGIDKSPESRPMDLDRMQDEFPDLADPCTLGGLLSLVRSAWGDGATTRRKVRRSGVSWWAIYYNQDEGRTYSTREYASEAEALVVALEAAP